MEYLVCRRVCELLQSGAVMNRSYQPHEGHIPYLLQLFIDYNLYGMNLLNLGAVKFRRGRKTGKRGHSPFLSLCFFLLCLFFISWVTVLFKSIEVFYIADTQTKS